MPAVAASAIAAVRRFNRFYTREVGLLRKTFLDTPWTLGEMRILFEIAHGDAPTASDIAAALELDAAYLSRLLRKFESGGLISRTPSKVDGRQSHLRLTAKGRAAFGPADKRQADEVQVMLGRLPATNQRRLVSAMATISELLDRNESAAARREIRLRQPKPGDFGWIISRHAEVYGEEYGWGPPFEGLCAGIVADFVNDFDPEKERCWIAEVDGERAGTIMLVKDEEGGDPDGVARIRLLLVEPSARGLGLGARLVDECVRFARAKGYRRVTLWTHSVLVAARAVYAKAGFVKTGEEAHDSWGKPVTSEFWDLDLTATGRPSTQTKG
ncbi:MAG: GNAT family N-acetyltransferase [Alphaproteobacteria bacterium]|nr:GNAT family N-acetyltransferase [Alphaproteobacteria bacterium]